MSLTGLSMAWSWSQIVLKVQTYSATGLVPRFISCKSSLSLISWAFEWWLYVVSNASQSHVQWRDQWRQQWLPQWERRAWDKEVVDRLLSTPNIWCWVLRRLLVQSEVVKRSSIIVAQHVLILKEWEWLTQLCLNSQGEGVNRFVGFSASSWISLHNLFFLFFCF